MEFLESLGRDVLDIVGPFLALGIAALAIAVLTKLFGKLGLDTEKLHRDAFQTMVSNAALDAVRRAGGPAVAQRIDDMHLIPAVKAGMAANPDAVAAFKAQPADVERRVLAQAVDLIQRTPATDVPLSTDGGASHRYAEIDKQLAGLVRR